jgi:pyrroline-5-carboxylate reductase
MKNLTLAFLGTGNMAEALIKGLLRSGTANREQIIGTARRPHRLEQLKTTYGIRALGDNVEAAKEADVIVL